MYEVKDIFERILDAPAPPIRASTEILASARRTMRRRAAMSALGAAAALATIVVGAVAIASGISAGPRSGPPLPPAAAITHTPTVPGIEPMPSLLDIDTHRAQILAALTNSVPAGLTPSHVESTMVWAIQARGAYITSARVAMNAKVGQVVGQGELEVHFCFESTEGACTAAFADSLAGITPDSRAVVAVDGQQIAVGTDNAARVIIATRFLGGGFVTVVSRQGSLATAPLTPVQAATVTMNPAILP